MYAGRKLLIAFAVSMVLYCFFIIYTLYSVIYRTGWSWFYIDCHRLSAWTYL